MERRVCSQRRSRHRPRHRSFEASAVFGVADWGRRLSFIAVANDLWRDSTDGGFRFYLEDKGIAQSYPPSRGPV